VGVVVRMDDSCEIIVKGNDGGGWSSDGVMLWLGRGKMKTWLSSGKSHQGCGIQVIWEGLSAAAIWI
jgi:hypothetical protein